MTLIDPEQESARLSEVYSQQTDEELEAIAGQGESLTDVALQALLTELTTRGLTQDSVEEEPDPVRPEPEFRDLTVVRSYWNLLEAELAKGALDAAGIECFLFDDNMLRMDWFISNLLGGVKLQVRPEDVAIAEEILSQPIPENFDVPGIGAYEHPRCPKCGSLDVGFHEITPVAYVSAYLNVPIPFHRRAWRCHSCDVEWEDDGVEDGEAERRS